MSVNVRIAVQADLPRILELYRELQPQDPPVDVGKANSVWAQAANNGITHFVAECDGIIAATCYVANCEGQIAAFILVEGEGETFISNTPGYRHITGAYCRTEHRGKGLNQSLINLAVRKLKAQGCTRLGTDFESINPIAYSFWRKYFDTYTHSVVRRIGEHIFPS